MPDYKGTYLHLAGAVADAIESVEGLESHLRVVKKALIKAQKDAEDTLIDVEDAPIKLSVEKTNGGQAGEDGAPD